MTYRSLYLGLAALVLRCSSACQRPVKRRRGPAIAPVDGVELVQQVDYYNRRWRYRDGTHVRAPLTAVDDDDSGTWVRAPFARVYSGRRGTWVRAPFVNLWIPR